MKRRGRFGAALTVGLFGLSLGLSLSLSPGVTPQAHADERDDAVAAQEKAKSQVASLSSEIEGLDADLADTFVNLQTLASELEVKEAEVTAAQAERDAAERKHGQIQEQLGAAQSELDRLNAELKQAQGDEKAIQGAVGTMAQDLYRGGSPSPLTLVMNSESSGDIAARVAAADTASRAQAQALESARETMAVTRNQGQRQSATAERISGLESEAAAALADAEEKEAQLEAAKEALEKNQAELEAKQKAWNSRKGEAQEQLKRWEKEQQKAADQIAKIDEENRRKAEEAQRKAEEAQRKAAAENTAAARRAAEEAAAAAAEAAGTVGDRAGSGYFQWPVPRSYGITSSYGWRMHPIYGYMKLHDGTDFGAPCGSPQYASAPGTVSASYYDSGGGNMVDINHGMVGGHSFVTEHLHLSSAAVSVGQQVDTNTVIGYTGTTGSSTGCHLHFTMYRDGSTVDPMDYLQ